MTMKKVLNIAGMGCSGCVSAVEGALQDLDGVQSATVNLDDALAEVHFDETKVTTEDFETAITEAGYEMTGVQA
jgi:copper ion binding protein